MIWYGKLIGALVGWMALRHPAGAVLGALLGHVFDAWWSRRGGRAVPPAAPGATRPRAEDDYALLGIAADASDGELERAYRRLMSQYHPDRVAGAAEEFRQLAEQRTRNINAAYDRIRTRRQGRATRPPN